MSSNIALYSLFTTIFIAALYLTFKWLKTRYEANKSNSLYHIENYEPYEFENDDFICILKSDGSSVSGSKSKGITVRATRIKTQKSL